MKQAKERSHELMDLADEAGRSIMDSADTEWKRAQEAMDYLKDEREMEQADEIWSYFYDRKNEIWSYFYDKGSDKWTEFYEKNRN